MKRKRVGFWVFAAVLAGMGNSDPVQADPTGSVREVTTYVNSDGPANCYVHWKYRRSGTHHDLFDIGDDMCKLSEGVTPAGQSLSQSSVEAQVEQYGAYVELSDILEDTAYDRVAADSAELLGEQIGTVMEW